MADQDDRLKNRGLSSKMVSEGWRSQKLQQRRVLHSLPRGSPDFQLFQRTFPVSKRSTVPGRSLYW